MLSTAAEQQLKSDFKSNTTWLQRHCLNASVMGVFTSSPCIFGLLLFHQTSPALWAAACSPIASMLALYALGYGDAFERAQEEALMRYIKDPATRLAVLPNDAGIRIGNGKDVCTVSGRQIARNCAAHAIIASVFARLGDSPAATQFARTLMVGGLTTEQIDLFRSECVPRPWRKNEVHPLRNLTAELISRLRRRIASQHPRHA